MPKDPACDPAKNAGAPCPALPTPFPYYYPPYPPQCDPTDVNAPCVTFHMPKYCDPKNQVDNPSPYCIPLKKEKKKPKSFHIGGARRPHAPPPPGKQPIYDMKPEHKLD